MRVIDASVAVKWFVREDHGIEKAVALLREIERDPRLFAVPELFFCEMLHVLNRLLRRGSEVQASIARLELLGFHRVGLGHELLHVAAELASEHRISGYDAIYAATAQLLDGKWITADSAAHRRISRLGISLPL